jgi:hypothetical protein
MDLITDRFGELLETLVDDPDRHQKIAREMGWFEDADEEDLGVTGRARHGTS